MDDQDLGKNPPNNSRIDINIIPSDPCDDLPHQQKFVLDDSWEAIPGGYRRRRLPGAE